MIMNCLACVNAYLQNFACHFARTVEYKIEILHINVHVVSDALECSYYQGASCFVAIMTDPYFSHTMTTTVIALRNVTN